MLRENRGMLGLVGRLGFRSALDPEDPAVAYTALDLRPGGGPDALAAAAADS